MAHVVVSRHSANTLRKAGAPVKVARNEKGNWYISFNETMAGAVFLIAATQGLGAVARKMLVFFV